tara:strand:+ start:54 stop:251 length:198 start_codon:yes stop_codon:yes gene_type:complete
LVSQHFFGQKVKGANIDGVQRSEGEVTSIGIKRKHDQDEHVFGITYKNTKKKKSVVKEVEPSNFA